MIKILSLIIIIKFNSIYYTKNKNYNKFIGEKIKIIILQNYLFSKGKPKNFYKCI